MEANLNASKSPSILSDWKVLAALAGFILLFYFGYLTGTAYIWEDALYYFYPFQNFFSASIAKGHFPLWIPGIENGVPFYSDPQAAVFYPFTWVLNLFLVDGHLPYLVFQRYIVAHVLFGGIGMFYFLKNHKLHPVACLIGAMAFCFSATMVLHIIHVSLIRVYSWWPLHFLLVKRATSTRQRRYYFWLAATLLLSVLGGYPATTLYESYVLIAYWLFCAQAGPVGRLCEAAPSASAAGEAAPPRQFEDISAAPSPRLERSFARANTGLRRILRELPKIAAIFSAVLLLSACFLLPCYESIQFAPRSDWSYREKVDTSLPPHYLSNLVVPNFFGTNEGSNSAYPNQLLTFWGEDKTSYFIQHDGEIQPWLYTEYGIYAGQIWLVAMAILLFNWKRLSRKRDTTFFLGLCGVALWFMLGKYGGLFRALYYTLPGIALFREPTHFKVVFNFATAILTALALHEVVEKNCKSLRKPLLACAVVFLALLLGFLGFGPAIFPELARSEAHARSLKWVLFSCGAFAWLSTLIYVAATTPKPPLKQMTLGVLTLSIFLDFYFVHGWYPQGKIDPDLYFRDRFSLVPQLKRMQAESGPFRAIGIGGPFKTEALFPRNFPMFHEGIEGVYGYVLCYNKYTDRFRRISNTDALLDLQNVGFIGMTDPDRKDTGEVKLCRYPNSLPRAQFYSSFRAFQSDENFLKTLDAKGIDYRSQIAVSAEDAKRFGLTNASSAEPVAAAEPAAGGLNEAAEGNRAVSQKLLAEPRRPLRRPLPTPVQFVRNSPESYTLHYRADSPGIIFVSEAFFPGWEAHDAKGRALPIIRVFSAFKGIVIAQGGEGTITVEFRPKILKIGLLISGVSALLIGGIWVIMKALSLRLYFWGRLSVARLPL